MSVIMVKVDCGSEGPRIIGYPGAKRLRFKKLTSTGREMVYGSCKQIIQKCRRLMRRCERAEGAQQS